MGEVNAAERAALSGTLGSLQQEFEQNFNCEQSLNKVWIWNYRMNKVWTLCEYGTFDCLGLEQSLPSKSGHEKGRTKIEHTMNEVWILMN